MRIVWLLLLFLFFHHQVRGEYHVFYENGKAGLRDESGKIILPASFDALGWTDGSFSVINQVTGYRKQSRWGLINLKEQFVTKAEYESLTSAGGDRVVAGRLINPYTRKFGCLDLNGKVTVPFHYDGISILGLRAIVFIKNGLRYEYGLIDLDNNSILPLRYREIKPVGTLRYAIQNFDQKTALFTEEGIKLTDFVIDSISRFSNGKAIIYQNFLQGLINREGFIQVQPSYRELKVNPDGVVQARPGDEWKILTTQNKEVKKILADELIASDNHYTIIRTKKEGLLDTNLNELIPLAYDFLSEIQNHLVVARRGKKYGILRDGGQELFPFDYDSLVLENNFVRTAARNLGQLQWSVYDTFAVRKTKKFYDYIASYNGKFFPARHRGYWGAVDRYGEEIIPCAYDSLLDFNHELITVKFKGLYGIINLDEKWSVLPQPNPLELVSGILYFEKDDTITFLKNTDKEIIYFTNNSIVIRNGHLEETLPNGVVKWVSFEGISSPIDAAPNFDNTEMVFEEHEGMRGILRDGRYGFIDSRGRLRVANRYEAIGKFSEGLAAARILEKWGYVNKDDQIVVNPNYMDAQPFRHGLAVVARQGKAGVINLMGKVILPLRYDSISVDENRFILYSGNKSGLAESNGNVLIEPRFDLIKVLPNDLVVVRDDKSWGVLTSEGLPVIPIVYDHIAYNPATDLFLVNKKALWVKLELN